MSKVASAVFQVVLFIFPWSIRKFILCTIYNFDIHDSAYIGFSVILARRLQVGMGSRIGNFSICNEVDQLIIGDFSSIGTFNYITGYPTRFNSHFSHLNERQCCLIIGNNSAITSRHYIDVTGGIFVGDFTTIAGIRSQLLTHSIDLKKCRQDASAISIGNYCFIGTSSIFMPGVVVPDYVVIGAGSLVNKSLPEKMTLYGGVPVKHIKSIQMDQCAYFTRTTGFVP